MPAGRPQEPVGNGRPRWMAAERDRRKAPGNRIRLTCRLIRPIQPVPAGSSRPRLPLRGLRLPVPASSCRCLPSVPATWPSAPVARFADPSRHRPSALGFPCVIHRFPSARSRPRCAVSASHSGSSYPGSRLQCVVSASQSRPSYPGSRPPTRGPPAPARPNPPRAAWPAGTSSAPRSSPRPQRPPARQPTPSTDRTLRRGPLQGDP